ncbi:MAG: PQQ-binding-like beta-propeller repeat protein [Bryobacteraceae bacterium]
MPLTTRRSFLAAPLAFGQPGPVRMIEPQGEARQYWTRWRGPSGQGLAEGSYPDRWSATENVRWKVPVPGRGNSSPILWRDRIFLTTATDGPRRALLCFRRSDGKLLWEHEAPAAAAEKLYWKNTYASSTPATDGERVYAWFGNAGLTAVNLDGSRAWHRDFGGVTLYHGSAGSPLLHRGRVIFFQDQRRGSFIASLDAATGKTVWQTPREERIGWGTPVAIHTGSREEIVVSSGNRVTAYAPDDGKLLWYCSGNTFETIPTPVAGNGLIYCSSPRRSDTRHSPGRSGRRIRLPPCLADTARLAIHPFAATGRQSPLSGERHDRRRHLPGRA